MKRYKIFVSGVQRELKNERRAVKEFVYTDDVLIKMGLDERQIEAVKFVKIEGRITNKEYQKKFDLKKRQSTDDLKELEVKGILTRIGTTGKGTYYVLKGRQRGERGIKGAPKGRRKKP